MPTTHQAQEGKLVRCIDCLKQIPQTKAISLRGNVYACCELHRDNYLYNLPEEQFPNLNPSAIYPKREMALA